MLDRNEAIALWRANNDDESLFRHALAVEATMRHFAAAKGEDPDWWGIVGLLHDIDYGRHPEDHLKHSGPILSAAGYPAEFIHAVDSHGYGICTEVEPLHVMEKILFACDELTGFIAACAMVRPSKSVLDIEPRSVKKKWGTAAFAAGVRRDIIEKGAAMLGMELDALILQTIAALRPVAAAIGLKGSL